MHARTRARNTLKSRSLKFAQIYKDANDSVETEVLLEWNIRVNKAWNGRPSLYYYPAKVLVKGKRYRYAKQRDCPLPFSLRGNKNDDKDNDIDNDNDNDNDNGNDNGNDNDNDNDNDNGNYNDDDDDDDNDSDSRPKRFLRSDFNCFTLSLSLARYISLSIRLSLSRSLYPLENCQGENITRTRSRSQDVETADRATGRSTWNWMNSGKPGSADRFCPRSRSKATDW